jgi:ketosteroid isomerase-like protein
VADGTVLLEPNMAPLVGKEAIGRMHQSFMDQFSIDATGPAVDVRVAGDLAVAYGRYEETITPKDGTLAAAHARDMAFFERVLAKEYTQVADGKLVDVAAQLAEMKAGRVEIESITIRDMKVHVAGDAAIVWMTAESKGAYKGKPFSERSKGVDFFARRDGRWQIVNSQMTTIKD